MDCSALTELSASDGARRFPQLLVPHAPYTFSILIYSAVNGIVKEVIPSQCPVYFKMCGQRCSEIHTHFLTVIYCDCPKIQYSKPILCPCIPGSSSAFHHVYEGAILASRQPSASPAERALGETRAAELNRVTSLFILRRTQEINTKYLPPKGNLKLVVEISIFSLSTSEG